MEQSPLLFGLMFQASLIMALGAQNLFVLEKGLLKDRSLIVVFICALCDVTLIFLGVMGAGAFFAQNAILTLVLKIAGAAFLLKYAYGKFQEARANQIIGDPTGLRGTNLKAIVLSALAVSLLNPHVYLDTVVLVGGYSTKFRTIQEKLGFALGASLFSVIWFLSIGLGAGFFSSVLKRPRFLKSLNYGTSALMTYLGVSLLLSV